MSPEEILQAVMGLSKGMSRPVYRGQADASWKLHSGALRRLRDAYDEDFPKDEDDQLSLVDRYHKKHLIMPMQVIDGDTLSDLQRLSVLQHQGAATGLLDFTEYPLIALWFACTEWADKQGEVFILDIGNPHLASNARSNEELMDKPFDPERRSGNKIIYYEPDRSLGARIEVQKSIFVIGNPLVPDHHQKQFCVPRESKKQLHDYLKGLGLSETALFSDIPGLATANATSKKLHIMESPSPDHYQRTGNLAYQEGRFDDALAAYESYATALPDVAQPNCLKGDTLAALGRFDKAILAYTRAIENLDRPIYFGGQVIVNREDVQMMSRALYYNRGNVRAAAGDHQGAITDYDAALQCGAPKADVLYNRGNSKFALEMFQEAHEDFEAVWSEQNRSSAALAMGNCKVMMGEFEDARASYFNGAVVVLEDSATSCRHNLNEIQKLLEILDGNKFLIRHEGFIVYVEADNQARQFALRGNTGNVGNTPSGMITSHGGKGYKGLKGLLVKIVSPDS